MNILTLFLSLLTAVAVTIVAFTYYKSYRTIERFSDETIELASRTIVENVTCLFAGTKELVQGSAGWFLSPAELSWDRPEWASYLLSVIRAYPHLPFFYIATTQGDYIDVGNLRLTVQDHYLSDPKKKLPADALYTMQLFKREGREKADETVYYYNEALEVVATEQLTDQEYDPRKRPWYLGAVEAKGIYWTEVYRYYDRDDLGITLSKPLYDPEGQLMGVIAADFSFKLLSEFFSGQKIGKQGRAYILDQKEKVVIPEGVSPEKEQILAEAMAVFGRDADSGFQLRAKEGHRYLVHITHLPVVTGRDWKIAIVVPFSDFFADFVRSHQQVLLIIVGISLLAMGVVIYFAKWISNPIVLISKEIDKIRQLDLTSEARVDSYIKEIYLIDHSVASMRHAFRSFVRYVPKEIVRELLKKREQITLGGEKKKIAIFFSEVIDFVKIAEHLSTEQLMPLLEEYFEGISKILLESKGNIDKYIGEGVMAFWGAPLEVEDQVVRCAQAALQVRHFIFELNERRRKRQEPEFPTRIGINVGTAIVGNIGTAVRMNYTAIGDAVNLASRLEHLCETYRVGIVISQYVKQELGEKFLVRPLDEVEIRGKKEREKIYELMEEEELCRRFTEGYEAFSRGDRKTARQLFEALKRDFPEDGPTQVYLNRLEGS